MRTDRPFRRPALEELERREVLSVALGGVGEAPIDTSTVGDVNQDGHFDQLDVVQVHIRGKFLSDQFANWTDGDWNEDGMFDQMDVVLALKHGVGDRDRPERVGPWAAEQPLARPDAPGPYSVGYQRFYPPEDNPQYQYFDLWYPAESGEGVPAQYTYEGDDANPEWDWQGFSLPALIAKDSPPVATDGPFPVVIYSHGSGAISFNQATTAEIVASHGFVVASAQHFWIDKAVIGRVDALASILDRLAAWSQEPENPFFQQIDTSRTGASGISRGGRVVQAMTSYSDSLGRSPDERVLAIVPIDAPQEVGFGLPEVPALVIGGATDVRTQFNAVPRYGVRLWHYGHGSSADICAPWDYVHSQADVPEKVVEFYDNSWPHACEEGMIANDEAIRLSTLYTVAFFKVMVADDERYGLFLERDYATDDEPNVHQFRVIGFVAGDVTGDGRFDRWDISAIQRAKKFRTGAPAVWHEGDFNGDGVFDNLDLVQALSETGYTT